MLSEPIKTTELARHEEAAILATLPDSPRLRQILGDLEILMMGEGFLHLSMDDLAARLRCSKGTLYRLAPNRDELFELVINIWLARARDTGWRQFDEADDWASRLVGFLAAAVVATKKVSLAYMRDLAALPRTRAALMNHQDRRDEDLKEIIQAGIDAGAFLDIHIALAADLMLTTMRRIVDPEFLRTVGLPIAEAFEEAYRILEYGFILEGRAPAKKAPAAKKAVGARKAVVTRKAAAAKKVDGVAKRTRARKAT